MEDVTHRFKIEGMTCSSCAVHAEKALQKIDGVTAAYVGSWHKGHAELVSEAGRVPISEIEQALAEVGYQYAELDPVAQEEAAENNSAKTVVLIILMILGFVIIAFVFTHRASNSPATQVMSQSSNIVAVEPFLNLTLVSTDNAPENPPIGIYADEAGDLDIPISNLAIPNADTPITVFIAGFPGCASCAVETRNALQLMNEIGSNKFQVIFVDIFLIFGPDHVAWFANELEATNVLWTQDTDGTFKAHYDAELDTTIIMNVAGEVLYRDDFITQEATLREQIDLALQQSG